MEDVFRLHYPRMAKLIAGIIRDPGRAEELAVELFLKLPSGGVEDVGKAGGWLHRCAIRAALDELRRRRRKQRIEHAISFLRNPRTPEDLYQSADQQSKVGLALSALKRRDAELLLLRADGLSYGELGVALSLNPKSVGTLLARAQCNFRKEYVKRYGEVE